MVDAKGAVDFSDVIAGTYDILAASSTQRYSVVRIASEAGIISGHSLNVPAGASLTFALSLVAGIGQQSTASRSAMEKRFRGR